MFLLTKILPLLVLPLGLALLLLLWGVVRGSRWPAAAALALLALFSVPLTGEALWRWLEWPHQRRSAAAVLAAASASAPPAAVVVLGGGRHAAPGSARISEWADADRFFAGLEAFQQLSHRGAQPCCCSPAAGGPPGPPPLPKARCCGSGPWISASPPPASPPPPRCATPQKRPPPWRPCCPAPAPSCWSPPPFTCPRPAPLRTAGAAGGSLPGGFPGLRRVGRPSPRRPPGLRPLRPGTREQQPRPAGSDRAHVVPVLVKLSFPLRPRTAGLLITQWLPPRQSIKRLDYGQTIDHRNRFFRIAALVR